MYITCLRRLVALIPVLTLMSGPSAADDWTYLTCQATHRESEDGVRETSTRTPPRYYRIGPSVVQRWNRRGNHWGENRCGNDDETCSLSEFRIEVTKVDDYCSRADASRYGYFDLDIDLENLTYEQTGYNCLAQQSSWRGTTTGICRITASSEAE